MTILIQWKMIYWIREVPMGIALGLIIGWLLFIRPDMGTPRKIIKGLKKLTKSRKMVYLRSSQ